MRLLFSIDTNDYDKNGKMFIRPSSRAIIIKGSKILMVYSKKYNYYKFPGGGINDGETPIDALIRETKEETGLTVLKDSIKEFGYVHRIQKSDQDDYEIFIQDNYYYICDVEETKVKQELDDYEEYEGFTLKEVDYQFAIDVNRYENHGPKDMLVLDREARVLEILHNDGYIK